MKKIIRKLTLFIVILASPVLALFFTSYSPEFAFHYIENDCYNHGAWIYDRIIHNTTPIDIAFIGSSHTIHAFQEEKMEKQIGSNYHLTNLGYCRYGRNLQYVLLKFLLKQKSPKLIVIEVHEDEEKNSHDIFPYLADTKDLLCTPTPINRDYFSDLFHGASARLAGFKARYIFEEKYPEANPSLYGYGDESRMATENELKENEEAWQRRLQRREIPAIEKIKMKYPLAYLEKIVGLLNDKKIPFLFVYLPESGSKLKKPKYAEIYQQWAPILYPPESIFNDTTNWMDASHLNNKGSGLLSQWMAGQLKNEFCFYP